MGPGLACRQMRPDSGRLEQPLVCLSHRCRALFARPKIVVHLVVHGCASPASDCQAAPRSARQQSAERPAMRDTAGAASRAIRRLRSLGTEARCIDPPHTRNQKRWHLLTRPDPSAPPMSSLTLKDLPDDLLQRLRERARQQRRSLNREAIMLLEQALAPASGATPASRAEAERDAQLVAWERLGSRWPGGDTALDAMVADIYDARTEGRDVDL